ncbi:hypothetical protein ElyMa_006811900 [Elysia marginata]|uniref:Uncharacterized protein n=1 Tax=Elysia marginata TaxID=1093978 RepID=A0AAV4J438_9GAST|nr:hypothetical protein ElyMa_006811900 [Elysia marginata]
MAMAHTTNTARYRPTASAAKQRLNTTRQPPTNTAAKQRPSTTLASQRPTTTTAGVMVFPKAFTYVPQIFHNECHMGAMAVQNSYHQATKFPKKEQRNVLYKQ